MAAPPTTKPPATWGTTGTVAEPTAGEKATGYVANYRPPADWMNWTIQNAAQWIDFLRGPNLNEWTRTTTGGGSVSLPALQGMGRDATSVDSSTLRYRVVVCGQTGGGANAFNVSKRGTDYVSRTNLPGTVTGTARGVLHAVTPIDAGGKWWCWLDDTSTSGDLCWTWPDDGTHGSGAAGSAILDGATCEWTKVVLPAGTKGLRGFATDGAGNFQAITYDQWIYGKTSGTVWGAATLAGRTGHGRDVVHDGTKWISIADDGTVYTSATYSGPFTNTATLGAGDWRLACGGGIVVAYDWNTGATYHTSADSGASWTSRTAPTGMEKLLAVKYVDGLWLAACASLPYLWRTATPATVASWKKCWIQTDESTSFKPELITHDGGAWLAVGVGFTLMSGRAADTEAT